MTIFTKSPNCNNCIDCNNKMSLFGLLTQNQLEEINNNRYEVCFKTGETIIKQGTSSTHIIILTSGIGKMYIEGVQEKNLIIQICKAWTFIGRYSLYFEQRHHYSFSALTEITACYIEKNVFKKILKENAAFTEAFLEDSYKMGVSNLEKMLSLSQKQMHGRIADGLLYLSEQIYNTLDLKLTLSRQDLADLTGMSKDSATRILKELHENKTIHLAGKNIKILNLKKLQKFSYFG